MLLMMMMMIVMMMMMIKFMIATKWFLYCFLNYLLLLLSLSLPGYAKICMLLLQHGSDVNALNNLQRTALHCNAENGRVDVANLLLSYKAGNE